MASPTRLGYKRQTLERRKRELRQRTGQNLDDYAIYRNYYYFTDVVSKGKKIDVVSYTGNDHDTLRDAITSQQDELEDIWAENETLDGEYPDEIRTGILPRSAADYSTKGTHRRLPRGFIRKGFGTSG